MRNGRVTVMTSRINRIYINDVVDESFSNFFNLCMGILTKFFLEVLLSKRLKPEVSVSVGISLTFRIYIKICRWSDNCCK